MRNCWIDQAGAFWAVAVSVKRMNFADVGLNEMVVVAPSPVPVATGVHVVPLSEVSTL